MSERRYDTPPKNKASLEQRLRNLIGDDALQLRARRQIGYIALIAALGLSPVGEIPLVTLAYMLAQKLHACTDHSLADRENDRARDLIDILLVRRLLAEEELPGVRRACLEIFRLREKHPWPPSVTVLPQWPTIYADELAKAPGFTPVEVEQAAADVERLIAEIDGAS